MVRKKKTEVVKVIICTDTVPGFFDRARKAAQKADRSESFKSSTIFSFEDSREAFKALSEASKGKSPVKELKELTNPQGS
jgi:hypothetical protein